MSGNNNVVSLNKDKSIARAKLARLPAPVHMLQEKSRHALQRLVQTLFDNADDALFELADKATTNSDQNLYFESMREVRVRRRDLENRFGEALTDAFACVAVVQHETEEAGSSLSQFNIDDLALVQNDELEEVVAVDSMINRANDRYGEAVQHLGMRIDSLVPQKIYQKNNPLGPEVIARAFAVGVRTLDADIKAKLVLLKLFDKYVLTQLNKFYQVCNQLLIEQNILPSLKQLKGKTQLGTPVVNGGAGVYPSAGGASVNSPSSGDMGLQGAPVMTAGNMLSGGQSGTAQQGEVLQVLRGLLSSQQPGSASNSGTAVSASPLPAQELVSVLSQLQQQYVQTGSQFVAGNQLRAAIDDYLKAGQKSARINQLDEDVINLVDMLFEFILDDRTLAAPMKALLGRMQIPILKVAIADKSFFSKGGHPARRLLNEMSTAALGWQDEGKDRDPLYEKIESIVHGLLTDFDDDISVFNALLTDFVSFIDKERRRASILEQRTLDAEDGKAKAEYARHQVVAALADIVGERQLPAAGHKLLHEAWGNVLFMTALKEGVESQNWKSALSTASDLVWSLTATIAAAERTQLLKLVPDLLKRLRAGLESISYNPFEMTELFKALEQLHLARIRGAVAETVAPAEPAAKADMGAAPVVSDTEVKPSAAVVKAEDPFADIDASMQAAVDKTGAPSAKQQSSSTDAVSLDEGVVTADAVEGEYLDQVDKLSQGAWFEMSDTGGGVYRCRLAAVLKPTGKYIFVNRSGVKVAEETRQSLAEALKTGSLRSLNDGVLFDRALESVISNLRRTRSSMA